MEQTLQDKAFLLDKLREKLIQLRASASVIYVDPNANERLRNDLEQFINEADWAVSGLHVGAELLRHAAREVV